MRKMRGVLPVIVGIVLMAMSPAACASFGFKEFTISATNEDGSPATEAGSHPFALTTNFAIETHLFPGEESGVPVDLEAPEGEIRELMVSLPPGLVGNTTAVPRCSKADFANIDQPAQQPACDSSTAVGIVAVDAQQTAVNPVKEPRGPTRLVYAPLYNLDPAPGVAAEFGFLVFNVPVTVEIAVEQTPPYSVVAKLRNVSQYALVFGSKVTIWGNPADEAHDSIRGHCFDAPNSIGKIVSVGSCPVDRDAPPLLTLPRACHGPLEASAEGVSWEGERASISSTVSPPAMTDCDHLAFGPEVEVTPTETAAESPTGLNVDVKVEDLGWLSSTDRAQSDIQTVVTRLPEGVTVNPAAAAGLDACTAAQAAAVSAGNAVCPEAAKVGSVKVTTPLIEEPLDGAIYIAQPDNPLASGAENPFDSLLAAYLVIRNTTLGLAVVQPGEIETDASTGRVTTRFSEVPQFPLSHIQVQLRKGPRAPLVTPEKCGKYVSNVTFAPWSGGGEVVAAPEFSLTSGPMDTPCPSGAFPPLHPQLIAGSLDSVAGAYSPFLVQLERSDGEQEMTRLDITLPPGVTGKIAQLTQCSDVSIAEAATKPGRSELATASCPQSSELGNVIAGAGVGSALTYVSGKAYLGGPVAGHPLSVVVITPAVAGPFDLGTVVVREGLDLDPITAEVQVTSSSASRIPRILQGVPVRLRDVRILTDRPNFTLNASSCEEESTRATIYGGGAIQNFLAADVSSTSVAYRYQASDCAALPFKPQLALRLKGGTKRSDHPALRSILIPKAGDANIAKAVVTLPRSEFLDQAHVSNPCTRVQFSHRACPKKSVLGKARAFTPLLSDPLEGPVYFRSNGGERELPDIVADLKGQFHIVLVGYVDSVHGRNRATFAQVPDAPVSKFVLSLKGGEEGLLQNSVDLCNRKRYAALNLHAQNGRVLQRNIVIQTDCRQTSGHGAKR